MVCERGRGASPRRPLLPSSSNAILFTVWTAPFLPQAGVNRCDPTLLSNPGSAVLVTHAEIQEHLQKHDPGFPKQHCDAFVVFDQSVWIYVRVG